MPQFDIFVSGSDQWKKKDVDPDFTLFFKMLTYPDPHI